MSIVAVQAEIEYRHQRLLEEAARERRVRAATARGGRSARRWIGRAGVRRSSVETA